MLRSMSAFEEHLARVRAGEPVDAVAADLVALLTPEERLGCLDGDLEFWPGMRALVAGEYGRVPFPAAAIPRLGIPGIQFNDGPRGAVMGAATCFPVAMGRGASFDPALEERIGDAIGRELRAQGANLFGGVCVNLLRHPAWGRAQESYGEDPFHVGEMGAALTRGARRHVMACVKHFALNSIECARFKVDVRADERTLHEVYLPHFRRAVEEGAEVVMSAYNAVNGAWCGENRPLLTETLRGEWGFEGIVISDWIVGLRDPVKSVKAGLDVEMPFRQQRAGALPAALDEGRISAAEVDAIATRVLATQLRYAARSTTPAPEPEVVACEAHRALAREAAEKAFVLVRNETVGAEPALPLDPSALRTLAVIGALAAVPNLGDRGSSNVRPPYAVTPLEGLRAALPDTEIVHVEDEDPAKAAEVARDADAAILVVGLTAREEGEYIEIGSPGLRSLFPPPPAQAEEATAVAAAAAGPGISIGGDRIHLGLSEAEVEQIRAVADSNPRTVVILMGGSAITMEGWGDRVPAVLYAWYPGMEGGHALARVLLGKVNPSGHLPFAVPTHASHLADFDRDATAITYDLWHGQWKLDRDGHAAALPFGFGLSYTTFSIVDASARSDGDAFIVTAAITNTGTRPGSALVQVYAGLPDSRYARPARKLVAFARVELGPGERREATFGVPVERLAVRDAGQWVLEPGTIRLTIAQHAADPGHTVQVHL